VQHLGEVQQGCDVALRRVRDEHGVRAAHGAVLSIDRVAPLVADAEVYRGKKRSGQGE
jgi:hypothetical protein